MLLGPNKVGSWDTTYVGNGNQEPNDDNNNNNIKPFQNSFLAKPVSYKTRECTTAVIVAADDDPFTLVFDEENPGFIVGNNFTNGNNNNSNNHNNNNSNENHSYQNPFFQPPAPMTTITNINTNTTNTDPATDDMEVDELLGLFFDANNDDICNNNNNNSINTSAKTQKNTNPQQKNNDGSVSAENSASKSKNNVTGADLMEIYSNPSPNNHSNTPEVDAFFDFGFADNKNSSSTVVAKKSKVAAVSAVAGVQKKTTSVPGHRSRPSLTSKHPVIFSEEDDLKNYSSADDSSSSSSLSVLEGGGGESNKNTKKKKNKNNNGSKNNVTKNVVDPALLPLPTFDAIPGPKKRLKKRHSAPVIPSSMHKQLQKEGLLEKEKKIGVNLQSPNIGRRLRQQQSRKNNNNNNNNESFVLPRSKSTAVQPSTTVVSPKKKSKGKNIKNNKKYNCLPELHRGTALLKYGRHGYPHFRHFNITDDNAHLRWFSQKKKMNKSLVEVKNINEVVTGQHTKEFRRISWNTLAPASFSIIYDKHNKSLNLVAKSVDEMKMWVEALRELSTRAKKGQVLSNLRVLEIGTDFRDRNRPQSRKHSGKFLRSHETKDVAVDHALQKKCLSDLNDLRKLYREISRESSNPVVQSTTEFSSIGQIMSELEERIEELEHEIRHTRNTKIAENDVWRTRVDLESLREKIRVLNKQHKSSFHKSANGGKRRWSVF